MTIQEAQAEINKCEQDITRAHSSLCSAAGAVGSSAKECADGSRLRRTLLPLLISLFGIIIFSTAWFWALVLIGTGIYIAYNQNQRAGGVVERVSNEQKTLDATISRNSTI